MTPILMTIPPDVIEKSKYNCLDWLGGTLGGLKEDAAMIIIECVKEFGGKEQASVIGTGIKTDVSHAALAKG